MSIDNINGNINLSTDATSLLKNGEEKSYKKVKNLCYFLITNQIFYKKFFKNQNYK